MKIIFTDDELREYVTISEHKIGNIKMAVLKTTHNYCSEILDFAVEKYVGDALYNEFVDMNFNDPWTRVIISNLNDLDPKDWIPFEKFLENR